MPRSAAKGKTKRKVETSFFFALKSDIADPLLIVKQNYTKQEYQLSMIQSIDGIYVVKAEIISGIEFSFQISFKDPDAFWLRSKTKEKLCRIQSTHLMKRFLLVYGQDCLPIEEQLVLFLEYILLNENDQRNAIKLLASEVRTLPDEILKHLRRLWDYNVSIFLDLAVTESRTTSITYFVLYYLHILELEEDCILAARLLDSSKLLHWYSQIEPPSNCNIGIGTVILHNSYRSTDLMWLACLSHSNNPMRLSKFIRQVDLNVKSGETVPNIEDIILNIDSLLSGLSGYDIPNMCSVLSNAGYYQLNIALVIYLGKFECYYGVLGSIVDRLTLAQFFEVMSGPSDSLGRAIPILMKCYFQKFPGILTVDEIRNHLEFFGLWRPTELSSRYIEILSVLINSGFVNNALSLVLQNEAARFEPGSRLLSKLIILWMKKYYGSFNESNKMKTAFGTICLALHTIDGSTFLQEDSWKQTLFDEIISTGFEFFDTLPGQEVLRCVSTLLETDYGAYTPLLSNNLLSFLKSKVLTELNTGSDFETALKNLTSGNLVSNGSLFVTILEELLSSFSVKLLKIHRNFGFKHLTTSSGFIARLFSLPNELHHEIMSHESYKMILDTVLPLLRSIEDKSISLSVIKQIVDGEHENQYCSYLLDWTTAFNLTLSRRDFIAMNTTMELFRCQRAQLLELFEQLRMASGDGVSLETELNTFESVESNAFECSMESVIDGTIWNSLQELLPQAKQLYQFKESSIFINLWSAVILNADTSHGISELVSSSIDIVNTQLNRFFGSLSDTSTVTIANLNEIWCNETTIEELLMLARIFNINIDMEVRQQIVTYSIRNSVSHLCSCILNLLAIFEKPDEELSLLFDTLKQAGQDSSSLRSLVDAIELVRIRLEPIPEDMFSVLIELSNAPQLIAFVTEISKEENLNLIDMVEEHSDSIIRAETVSDLDVVKRYLKPVFSQKNELPAFELLKQLTKVNSDSSINVSLLPAKISGCNLQVHGLRDLWKRVANREESTKETVKQVATGSLTFTRILEDCSFRVSVEWRNHDGNVQSREFSFLSELRSRALLLVNSAPKLNVHTRDPAEIEETKRRLKIFIDTVQLASSISKDLSELLFAGHFALKALEQIKFNFANQIELIQKHSELEELKQSWNKALTGLRNEYCIINWFFSHQFWILEDFLTCCCDKEITKHHSVAVALLKYVGFSMGVIQNSHRVNYSHSNFSAAERLQKLCDQLEMLLSGADMQLCHGIERDCADTFLVPYQSNVNLFPSLFAVMQNQKIQRFQLLFCEPNIQREEITAFLCRVFGKTSSKFGTFQVFAILNIHNLDHERRSELVREISRHSRNKQNNSSYLAILQRVDTRMGTDDIKFPQENIRELSVNEMQTIFSDMVANVTVVSSNGAGCGKSEFCATEAFNEHNKRLHVVSISDKINRQEMLEKFFHCKIQPFQCYHLELTNLASPFDIGIGLFEALFLHTCQIGTFVAHISGDLICYVEVASGNKNNVQDLHVAKFFPQKQIPMAISDLRCDADVTGNLQLVCNYLKCLEDNSLKQKDLRFVSEQLHTLVLTADECRGLLNTYFFKLLPSVPSFSVFQVFLDVLADQLRKFTNTSHFEVNNLKWMGADVTFRIITVDSLVTCARNFATRSVQHVKKRQDSALGVTGQDEVDDLIGLVKWESDNQLFISISDFGTIKALYRELALIDTGLKTWINSQCASDRKLREYYTMSSDELRRELSEFCGLTDVFTDRESYVVTGDNFLKMVMVLLRINANLPVIVMGEAGCGKTSLIRFLADVKGATLLVQNIHAGTSSEEIIRFVELQIQKDAAIEIWIFFDEVNTCNQLGLMNSIICNRKLLGKTIPSNIRFMAACNPYKKKKNHVIVGLDAQQKKSKPDELSGLVYRVHPLPNTMIDYLWDFGRLQGENELLYINSIFAPLIGNEFSKAAVKIITEAVSKSQQFTRTREGSSSASMRDARRVLKLVKWFNLACKRKNYNDNYVPDDHKSIILALAHCYRCRIPGTPKRYEYDSLVASCFDSPYYTSERIANIILKEQRDNVERMKLDRGIALNGALLENIFVVLICILNKLPVFLVGKPGSSKSLAMSLIASNLRGPDSENEFFRQLPEVKVISFQGSESSTSAGILRIFDKAEAYAAQSKDAIIVVLLDEVGLAEISPYNPLKVLHALLEKDNQDLNIAVVGISNWTMDSAKMSRAIHLSRPEPSSDDLYQTAITIVSSIIGSDLNLSTYSTLKSYLKKLAPGYLEFYKQELKSTFSNFHGLRDYYSLCKYLGLIEKRKRIQPGDVCVGIRRNFSGLLTEIEKAPAFLPFFELNMRGWSKPVDVSTKQLILQNLKDVHSRHLMIITKGDSVLNTITKLMKESGALSSRVIVGSKLVNDQSEAYKYRLLSEIILSMERGESLVLKDLDSIYGSLYDMLNQNYTVIAGKRNCRVALGAFSNPMAHVHELFSCCVIIEQSKVASLDPPFLNRFEKYYVNLSSLLNQQQRRILTSLKEWVTQISSIHTGQGSFDERDLFVGYCEDTLASLVFELGTQNSNEIEDPDKVLETCKSSLLRTATTSGMARISLSNFSVISPEETNRILCSYLTDDKHNNLFSYVSDIVQSKISTKSLVTTFTNYFHYDYTEMGQIPPSVSVIGFTISDIDSSNRLTELIRDFYATADKSLLIIQFNATLDMKHYLLCKFIIDKQGHQEGDDVKHVIMLMHLRSELYEEDKKDGYDSLFSQGWEFYHIDALDMQEERWKLLDTLLRDPLPIKQFLACHENTLKSIIASQLMYCFRFIHYSKSFSKKNHGRLKHLCEQISSNDCLMHLLSRRILQSEHLESDETWLLEITCNKEHIAFSANSLSQLIDSHFSRLIKVPLAKTLFLLEKYSCIESLSTHNVAFFESFLLHFPPCAESVIPDPTGMECYQVGFVIKGLQTPFVAMLLEQCDSVHKIFVQSKYSNDDNDCYDQTLAQLQDHLVKFLTPFAVHDASMLKEFLLSIANLNDDILVLYSHSISQVIQSEMDMVDTMRTVIKAFNIEITTTEPLPFLLSLWTHGALFSQIGKMMRIAGTTVMRKSSASNVTKICLEFAIEYCSSTILPKESNLSSKSLVEWNEGAKEQLALVVELCSIASINLKSDSVAYWTSLDPTLNLLRRIYIIRILLDISALIRYCSDVPLNFLSQTENWNLPATFFAAIAENLLSPDLDLSNDAVIPVLTSISERFLYVESLIVKLNPEISQEEMDVLVCESGVMVEICKFLGSDCVRSNPPVACANVSHLILDKVMGLVERCCETNNKPDLFILLDFPEFKTLSEAENMDNALTSFDENFSEIHGSPLEIMLADIVYQQFLPEWDIDDVLDDQDEQLFLCQIFESSLQHITLQQSPLLMICSMAAIKTILDLIADILALAPEEDLPDSFCRLLQTSLQGQESMARACKVYLVKNLHLNVTQLQTYFGNDGLLTRQIGSWFISSLWEEKLGDIRTTTFHPIVDEKKPIWDTIWQKLEDELVCPVEEICGQFTPFCLDSLESLVHYCISKSASVPSDIFVRSLSSILEAIEDVVPLSEDSSRLLALLSLLQTNFETIQVPDLHGTLSVDSFLLICLSFHLTTQLSKSKESLLGILMFDPQKSIDCFLIGSNLQKSSTLDPSSPITLWQCLACEFVHTHGTVCINCFQESIEYIPSPIPRGKEEFEPSSTGYTFPNQIVPTCKPTRDFSPAEYWISRLFVECSIFGGLLMNSSPTFPHFLNQNDMLAALSSTWQKITTIWKVCLRVISQPKERLSNLLHSLLCRLPLLGLLPPLGEDQRLIMERKFINECHPLLKSLHTTEIEIGSVEKELFEYMAPPTISIWKFLRCTNPGTFENFRNSFYLGRYELVGEYPVIAAFLRFEDKLEILSHLHPIIHWTNEVRKSLSFSITKECASEMSMRDMIEYSVRVGNPLSESDFNAFANAMNEIHNLYPHLLDSTINLNSPFMSSCFRMEDGHPSSLSSVLHYIADIQTSFLDAILQTQSYDESAGFGAKPVLKLKKSEIICYDNSALFDSLQRHSRNSLNYGEQTFDYDWKNIQKVIGVKVIRSKVRVGGENPDFRFKNETFHKTDRNLFAIIDKIVLQEPLPDAKLFRMDRWISDEVEVETRLMPAIQSLLFLFQNCTPSEGLGSKLISEFAEEYLDSTTAALLRFYEKHRSLIASIEIKHLEACYEVLEDVVSDTILSCIDEKYNIPLSLELCDILAAELIPFLGGWNISESVFRRFIIRYLRGVDAIEPDLEGNDLYRYTFMFRFPREIDPEDATIQTTFSLLGVQHCLFILHWMRTAIEDQKRQESSKAEPQKNGRRKSRKPTKRRFTPSDI